MRSLVGPPIVEKGILTGFSSERGLSRPAKAGRSWTKGEVATCINGEEKEKKVLFSFFEKTVLKGKV